MEDWRPQLATNITLLAIANAVVLVLSACMNEWINLPFKRAKSIVLQNEALYCIGMHGDNEKWGLVTAHEDLIVSSVHNSPLLPNQFIL
jgi:hypothetical protein